MEADRRFSTEALKALVGEVGDCDSRAMYNGSPGSLLRQARHRARISQASVAALMSTTQTRISRWESGDIAMLDHELDEALAICGAQRSGPRTLSDLLTPLRGEDQLSWHCLRTPNERIRVTSLHCSAVGKPLAGVSWPALLGALKMVSGMTGYAVSGAVARSLRSPDRTKDEDLAFLDLEALPASEAWALPARLPMMSIRVTQVSDEQAGSWRAWPKLCGWPHALVLVSQVQSEAQEGRTAP